MSHHFSRIAAFAAACATTLAAQANPVTLNFKATITSQHDFATNSNPVGDVGKQVSGYFLLDVQTLPASYGSESANMHTRDWYSASGCFRYTDSNCTLLPQSDPAFPNYQQVVLGYSVGLPAGTASSGSMMSSGLGAANAGIHRMLVDSTHYQYSNVYYMDWTDIQYTDAYGHTSSENQTLNMGGWVFDGSLFSGIERSLAQLNFLNSPDAFVNFTYYKQECFSNNCRFDPGSMDYQMKLTEISVAEAAATVPEPGSLALLGLGLLGLGRLRRRS